MKPQKISVIISVYKNTAALEVVLKELQQQTILPDEIIISEDGDSQIMKEFIDSLHTSIEITHLTQEDIGWRKNKALNRSIVAAKGDYLIFIDGDVVPHKRFIEGHLYCSKPKRVCAGKRAELGPKYSQLVLENKLSINDIADNYFKKIIPLHKDNIRHYEDGIYIRPNGFLYNNIVQKKKISYLIGCNFSCYKEDILSINGFDEDYTLPSVGEDVDINWRFRRSGIEVISCRNIANVYHLWHKKGFGSSDLKTNDKIFHSRIASDQYICINGIKKLDKEATK